MHQVPRSVRAFVLATNRALRLDWAGWDVIRTENGKLQFIEVNPIFGTVVMEQRGIELAPLLAGHVASEIARR